MIIILRMSGVAQVHLVRAICVEIVESVDMGECSILHAHKNSSNNLMTMFLRIDGIRKGCRSTFIFSFIHFRPI